MQFSSVDWADDQSNLKKGPEFEKSNTLAKLTRKVWVQHLGESCASWGCARMALLIAGV